MADEKGSPPSVCLGSDCDTQYSVSPFPFLGPLLAIAWLVTYQSLPRITSWTSRDRLETWPKSREPKDVVWQASEPLSRTDEVAELPG